MVSFFFENGTESSLGHVQGPLHFAEKVGTNRALDFIRAWAPDVVYCNGLDSPKTELALTGLAPSVYSAHAFVGTCISGRKMHSFPTTSVCQKRYGPACLAYFYPRRCGGLNPVTMLARFQTEKARLATIRAYSALVVHSEYMRTEYRRHGIDSTVVPLPLSTVVPAAHSCRLAPDAQRKLLFLGRLYDLKGCETLIDAAVHAAHSLPRLRLTVAGDGEDRNWLEEHARAVSRTAPNLSIRFVGRVDQATRDALIADTHALVVPSLWPEPFGMVGLEAAAFGIPAVAFRVGGIPEWLRDGVSGCLAHPPSSKALAKALVDCVGNAQTHARLSEGARAVHAEFAGHHPIAVLESIFEKVISGRTT